MHHGRLAFTSAIHTILNTLHPLHLIENRQSEIINNQKSSITSTHQQLLPRIMQVDTTLFLLIIAFVNNHYSVITLVDATRFLLIIASINDHLSVIMLVDTSRFLLSSAFINNPYSVTMLADTTRFSPNHR
jgi:hypothetical protein